MKNKKLPFNLYYKLLNNEITIAEFNSFVDPGNRITKNYKPSFYQTILSESFTKLNKHGKIRIKKTESSK